MTPGRVNGDPILSIRTARGMATYLEALALADDIKVEDAGPNEVKTLIAARQQPSQPCVTRRRELPPHHLGRLLIRRLPGWHVRLRRLPPHLVLGRCLPSARRSPRCGAGSGAWRPPGTAGTRRAAGRPSGTAGWRCAGGRAGNAFGGWRRVKAFEYRDQGDRDAEDEAAASDADLDHVLRRPRRRADADQSRHRV